MGEGVRSRALAGRGETVHPQPAACALQAALVALSDYSITSSAPANPTPPHHCDGGATMKLFSKSIRSPYQSCSVQVPVGTPSRSPSDVALNRSFRPIARSGHFDSLTSFNSPVAASGRPGGGILVT